MLSSLFCMHVCVCVCVCAGMYGQLGHGDKEKQVTPKLVEALTDKTIYLLACGNFHTVSPPMPIVVYMCIECLPK